MKHQPINQILLNLRENQNLKQKDIAKVLGITQQTYSNYERGKREMSIRHLIPLAEFYNISLDQMLNLTPSSVKNPQEDNEFANGVTMDKLIYDLTILAPFQRKELLKFLEYLKQMNP